MSVQRNTQASSSNHCSGGKAVLHICVCAHARARGWVRACVCVDVGDWAQACTCPCVATLIQQATRICHTVFSFSGPHHIFRHYFINKVFGKTFLKINVCFNFLYNIYLKYFFLRRVQRDIFINEKRFHVEYPLLLWDFNKTSIFSTDFQKKKKKSQVPNFIKIRPLGGKLFHEDVRTNGQTDITKLTVGFRNFKNAPKNRYFLRSTSFGGTLKAMHWTLNFAFTKCKKSHVVNKRRNICSKKHHFNWHNQHSSTLPHAHIAFNRPRRKFVQYKPHLTVTNSRLNGKYKVVQIWPGLTVFKQVTVCPGHIWTTLYYQNTPQRAWRVIRPSSSPPPRGISTSSDAQGE
jgi:hypothetical protein